MCDSLILDSSLHYNQICCSMSAYKYFNKDGFYQSHYLRSISSLYFSLEDHRKCSSLCISFSSVQSLSHVQLLATPWITARQASLSITNSRSLLKLMSIDLVMLSNHLILCHPLLLPPSIFPSIRVFSNESVLCIRWPEYWSFSFNISPY